MASAQGLGGEGGGGEEAPDSGFRRRRLPVIATATSGESWSFSSGAPAQATPSATAYVTPYAVLPAPGDPDLHGVHAQGLQGCLWPPDLPVAGSHDMDTPAGEIHTHVSCCPMQSASFPRAL